MTKSHWKCFLPYHVHFVSSLLLKIRIYYNHKAIISLPPECPDQYLFVCSMQQSASFLIQKGKNQEQQIFYNVEVKVLIVDTWSLAQIVAAKCQKCTTFVVLFSSLQQLLACIQTFTKRKSNRAEKLSRKNNGKSEKDQPFSSCKLPSLFFLRRVKYFSRFWTTENKTYQPTNNNRKTKNPTQHKTKGKTFELLNGIDQNKQIKTSLLILPCQLQAPAQVELH